MVVGLGRFWFTGVGVVGFWLLLWFMVVVFLTSGVGWVGLGSGMWSLLGFRQTWVVVGLVMMVGGGGCLLVWVWGWGWVLLVVVLGFVEAGPRSRFTVRVGFCSILVLLNIFAISFCIFFPLGLIFWFSCGF